MLESIDLGLVYRTMAYLFGGLLVLFLVLGEIFDGLGELFESLGDIAEGLLEMLPFIDSVDFDGGLDADGEVGKVGIFRLLLIFLTTFGAGGHFALVFLGVGSVASLLIATSAGIAAAVIGYFILRWLYSLEQTGARLSNEYLGVIGTVSVIILPGSKGEIVVDGPVGIESLIASADTELQKGRRVRIIANIGNEVVVEASE